jgi:hypothetical protein
MAWLLDCNCTFVNSIFCQSQTAQIQTPNHHKQPIADSPVNNANQSGADQGNSMAEQATNIDKRGLATAKQSLMLVFESPEQDNQNHDAHDRYRAWLGCT